MAEPKKRRILERDWLKVAAHITDELKRRKSCKYRKYHEGIWKEVDRQVKMESMTRKSRSGQNNQSWRSALELGELSRASEIISADIRRLAFPNRGWFEPHSELPKIEDVELGATAPPKDIQQFVDGKLTALMTQQHQDFGFKARQDLSIKEGLHHGSYVVEVGTENMLGAKGPNVKGIQAPVWIPHSMWNCYPDPSKSMYGTSLFYTGNMIICSYRKLENLKRESGKGWRQDQIREITPPKKGQDVEIITWHGDVIIDRKDGSDIYLPNVKVCVADNKIIYYEANPLPYSRIIYNGYERLDVRDPYYVSPLTKMSPTQKIASALANKYIDSIEMEIQPPYEYDGNNPEYAAQGGPLLQPGTGISNKNLSNKINVLQLGDSQAALQGLQYHSAELQKGTGVDAVRSGMSTSTEQTATEVERTHQGGQIRTVDFLSKHEEQGLRPWLYLQHEMNKEILDAKEGYKIYNPEINADDFMYVKRSELPDNVHFEITGSKGVIEEEQRQRDTMQVTSFLMSIGMGQQLDMQRIAKEMYQDAGNKNAERFILQQGSPEMQLAEMQAQMQQMQEEAQQIAQENQNLKMQEQSRMADAQVKQQSEAAKAQNDQAEIQMKAENERIKIETEAQIKREQIANEAQLEAEKIEAERETAQYKVDKQMELEFAKANLQRETHEMNLNGTEMKKETEAKEKEDLIELAKQMAEKFERIGGGLHVVRDEKTGRALDLVPRKLDS